MSRLKRRAWELELSVRGNTLKYKRQLEQWQWKSREEVDRLQKSRLESLLRHAFEHVPYYREPLGSSGVFMEDGDINLQNFRSVRLLDKDAIKANFESLQSDDLSFREWCTESSGGSTGMPVNLIQDKEYIDWSYAIKLLDDEWSGLPMGERRAFVWGSVRDTLVGNETFKTNLGRWIRNEIWLNSFRMSPEQMGKFVDRINKYKPIQITAFAENIYDLTRYIEERDLHVYSPKAILTSAGILYPHMREKIERVFKAPVFNRYGSREVGDIACECGHHRGLHISAATHYVEIVKEDGTPAGPGEYGEIVITLLTNFAMPLIRYRIGDLGVMSDEVCPCGRGLPILKDIIGRTTDIFINSSGDRIDGRMFIRLLMLKPFIKKFQVVQEAYDSVRIIIDPVEKFVDHRSRYARDLAELADDTRSIMGETCGVEFEFVDGIETTASGKYRFTVSKVHDD
jgi:phenylacetate-CoA ligase